MGLRQKVKDLLYIGIEKIKGAYVKTKSRLRHYFEKALNMMKTVVNKIAGKVRGVILGASHFVRKVGNKYQEGTKNYSLEEEIGQWNETTVTRDIELEEVPREYQTMEDEFEVDDTRELDAALTY